jgi:hypothetical protein
MRDLPSNRRAGSTSPTPSRVLVARIWSIEPASWLEGLGAVEPLMGSLRVVHPERVVTIRQAAQPVSASAPVRTDPPSPWPPVIRH